VFGVSPVNAAGDEAEVEVAEIDATGAVLELLTYKPYPFAGAVDGASQLTDAPLAEIPEADTTTLAGAVHGGTSATRTLSR